MAYPPGILARGPWPPGRVRGRWSDHDYDPPRDKVEAADAAIAALHDRGSPAHDGVAARLAGYTVEDGELRLDLQRMRWALRLVDGAEGALSATCVVRDPEGRWLAGRRAGWVATWAGMWALGAGGAVDAGEDPANALARELREEWGVEPERLVVEALIATPGDMTFLIGQARLRADAVLVRDHEHDAHEWWPPDPADWPDHAHPQLRALASLLA